MASQRVWRCHSELLSEFVLGFRGRTAREFMAKDKSVPNFTEDSLHEVSYETLTYNLIF